MKDVWGMERGLDLKLVKLDLVCRKKVTQDLRRATKCHVCRCSSTDIQPPGRLNILKSHESL